MPQIKNALLRYRLLNSCFTNRQKRYWSIAELIDKLSKHDILVERRTLESDFETMRHDERLGFHVPLAYSRKEKGFYYTDANFSIDHVPLTEEDLQALLLATNILHQYKNVKLVQQFEGLVDRLGKVVSHLQQPQNNKLIAFENTGYYKGNDFFDDVLSAITNQDVLRVIYRKFAGAKNDEHIFHPYFLKEYLGRWYVLGYSEARHYVLILALDRFVKIEVAPHTAFKENKTLKPKEYFQHTLGITLGKSEVEEIELCFSPAMAPYIKTQHVHHSQKTLREDEHGLVIMLKLIPNPELVQLILGYGADVKVLKPESLQVKIKEVFEVGRKLYA